MRSEMLKAIAVAAFALAIGTSAQALSPSPHHQLDGMKTDAQDVRYLRGGRGYGIARGYGGYRGYGGFGYRRYGYGGYGYRRYGYGGYRPGYGVARRQVRRCALWGAGAVCRRWY
jgi:hypothetical protein